MNTEPNAPILARDPAGDHTIALAVKCGDEQAFGVLAKRYQRKLFAVALRYAHVREDAGDIVTIASVANRTRPSLR